MSYRVKSGITDQYLYFVAVDSVDFTTRETGLSSFTVYRSRNGGTLTAMTTPTVIELSASNAPGVYGLLMDEDMTIGSGNTTEEMLFHISHAGMAPVSRVIELYDLDLTASDILTQVNTAWTTQVGSSVPSVGSRPTREQAIYMMAQFDIEKSVSGSTVTIKAPDGTTLFTGTLSGTPPDAITRNT